MGSRSLVNDNVQVNSIEIVVDCTFQFPSYEARIEWP